MVSRVIVLAALLGAAGCAKDVSKPVPVATPPGVAATLLPGGNYHLLSIRHVDEQQVVCLEPSPDWAVAFGQSLEGSANLSAKAVSGGATLKGEGKQTITELAGRTAGVIALRDGLFYACQAYANRMIGRSAYALILSQYGQLLLGLATETKTDGAVGASVRAETEADGEKRALLVSCIVEFDPSVRKEPNAFLQKVCPIVLGRMGGRNRG